MRRFSTDRMWMAAIVAGVLLLTASAFGAPVDFEKAQGVAQKHLDRTRRGGGKGGKIKSAQRPQVRRFTGKAAPYFLVEKEDNGFVIVSGDDIAVPILGEIDNGNIDKENMPPAMVWLLGTYEKQIEEAVKNGATQDEETRQLWEEGILSSSPVMAASYPATLLSTTWDQGEPYNLQCPLDGTQKSPTGCAATVMAQIMKYWQHPTSGTGTSASYYTTTKNIFVPSVSFNTSYNYANMLDSYTASSGTTTQRDAVSMLMYHCGVSVRMDYSSVGSGAYSKDVATALTQYFDYDNSIRYISSGNSQHPDNPNKISASDWKDLVIGQIENNSPILFSGIDVNDGSGHGFIIDGYSNANDRFHLNWGWGGNYDGFFALTALNPNTYQFNDDHAMIINIMPNKSIQRRPRDDNKHNAKQKRQSTVTNKSKQFRCFKDGNSNKRGYQGKDELWCGFLRKNRVCCHVRQHRQYGFRLRQLFNIQHV